MQPAIAPSTVLKILLPLFLAIMLNIAPQPHRYIASLREARQAVVEGQHAAAAAYLGEALALAPWRVDLVEPLAWEAFAAGQDDRARSAFEQARSVGLLSSRGLLALGQVYARQGESDAALATWESLRQQPDFADSGLAPQVFEQMVRVQSAHGSLEDLVATLQAWYQLDPGSPALAYSLGLNLIVIDPVRAQSLLSEASAGDPIYAGRVEALSKGLVRAAQAQDEAYGWLMIGRALGQIKEWRLAQVAFEKALRVSPAYGEAWAFLAEARYQNNLPSQDAMTQAQQYAPDSPVVRALAALYWRRSGRPELALEYLQAVAEKEPNEPTWQLELGSLLAEKGDLVAAREKFLHAIEIAPQSPVVIRAVVEFTVQYHVETRDLGLPLARRLVLMLPEDAGALDLMGQVLMGVGDLVSAERFLQRSLQVDSMFAPAYLHLGQVYLQAGDTSRAHLCLRQALSLSPGDAVGELARRLLRRFFNEEG